MTKPDRRWARVAWRGVVLAALAIIRVEPTAASELTEQEAQGREIYLTGTAPGGPPIQALLGRAGTAVPANLVPCGSCHGEDGLGRPEGAVAPPNITWRELTKAYGHRHAGGRSHAPFDEASLAAAVTGGVDPAGQALDPVMPRYRLTGAEIDSLIAYLKVIERSYDPGLTDSAIRIGTVQPATGRLGAIGSTVEQLLAGYFERINAAGGIFGRRIELVPARLGTNPADVAAGVREIAETEPVFAIVAGFTPGVERDVLDLVDTAGIPNVGPFAHFAGHPEYPQAATFYIRPGLPILAAALAEAAATSQPPAPHGTVVVLPEDDAYDAIAGVIETRLRRSGWLAPKVVRLGGARDATRRRILDIAEGRPETVFFFADPAALVELLRVADEDRWSPRLYLWGGAAGPVLDRIPRHLIEATLVAFAELPTDVGPRGAAELDALVSGVADTRQFRQYLGDALAAAKVTVEALRRAGRSLSRSRFIEVLEDLYGFETDVTRTVSFGPGNRFGIDGAYVVRMQPAVDSDGWRARATWLQSKGLVTY